MRPVISSCLIGLSKIMYPPTVKVSNYPIDTAQNFQDLAKKWGASLHEEPELRCVIFSSLQVLIQQNRKAQEDTLDSLSSSEQVEGLELSLAEQRANSRYNSKVASKNLKILTSLPPQFLSNLFNIFMSSLQDKCGYLQATMADIASVSEKAVVKQFFISAMQKRLKVTQEAIKSGHAGKSSMEVDDSNNEPTVASTRAQLLDLAVSLLQGHVEVVNMPFAATKPALQDDEGLVQKKAYKVLVVACKERLSKFVVGELQCFGTAETMLLSTQLSGAAILKVLPALSSLASSLNKEMDDEVLPDRGHDESVRCQVSGG